MPITLSILRRPTELVRLRVRRIEKFAPPKVGAPIHVETHSEFISPIDGEDPVELVARWQRLAEVSTFDDQTAEDIAFILGRTTPESTEPCVPPWRPPVIPKPARASVVHPRAHKGTKYQPPTQLQTPTVDLRPHLCNARDCRAILRYLADNQLGDEWDFSGVLFHQQVDHLALPDALRKSLGYLGLSAPDRVSHLIGLYWDLELATNISLRRVVAGLLQHEPWNLDAVFAWCTALKSLPPSRRVAVGDLLLARDYIGDDFRLLSLQKLSDSSDDETFCNRVWALLQCDESAVGLMAGIELANLHRPKYDFDDMVHDETFDGEPIAEWGDLVASRENKDEPKQPYTMELWNVCGALDGLTEFLKRRPWRGFDANVTFEIVDPFMACRWDPSPEIFNTLLTLEEAYIETIRALPREMRSKGICIFRAAVEEAGDIRQELDRALKLIKVVCVTRSPAVVDWDCYTTLLKISEGDFAEVLALPPSSILAMEKTWQRENDARLIRYGLESLIKNHPNIAIEAMKRCPATLMRTAKTFGCLQQIPRRQLMEEWLQHPLFETHDDVRVAISHIQTHLPDGVSNPVPRKARDFADGKTQLTEGQITRVTDKIREELHTTQIDLLGHLSLEVLASSICDPNVELKATNPAVAHAARMQSRSGPNRRGLRKFLSAYLAGETLYLEDHAANQNWLRQHPKIDGHRWKTGVTKTSTVKHHGELRIAIEPDPLEVLQLGSYVGSCLSVGGIMAMSAAAVVLDINKTVAYARDLRNRVVARQLLAISDDDKLVCFNVYPTEVSTDIKDLFAVFDHELAENLDLQIYRYDETVTVEISRPLSQDWWNDDTWNPSSESNE